MDTLAAELGWRPECDICQEINREKQQEQRNDTTQQAEAALQAVINLARSEIDRYAFLPAEIDEIKQPEQQWDALQDTYDQIRVLGEDVSNLVWQLSWDVTNSAKCGHMLQNNIEKMKIWAEGIQTSRKSAVQLELQRYSGYAKTCTKFSEEFPKHCRLFSKAIQDSTDQMTRIANRDPSQDKVRSYIRTLEKVRARLKLLKKKHDMVKLNYDLMKEDAAQFIEVINELKKHNHATAQPLSNLLEFLNTQGATRSSVVQHEKGKMPSELESVLNNGIQGLKNGAEKGWKIGSQIDQFLHHKIPLLGLVGGAIGAAGGFVCGLFSGDRPRIDDFLTTTEKTYDTQKQVEAVTTLLETFQTSGDEIFLQSALEDMDRYKAQFEDMSQTVAEMPDIEQVLAKVEVLLDRAKKTGGGEEISDMFIEITEDLNALGEKVGSVGSV